MNKTIKLGAAMLLILFVSSTATYAQRVLIVGGGSSHDFERWYKQEDVNTLTQNGGFTVRYTDKTDSIAFYLKSTDVLVLSNNQDIAESGKRAIDKFVKKGKGLVLLHAAVWYNWQDWPEYNLNYVGGGSRSHENFQEFKNYVVHPTHPITQGVSARFDFKDELYRHEFDPKSPGVEVLVIGQSKETDLVYPVVYTVKHKKSKIAAITLGHDEHSHQHKAYQTLLVNTVKWAAQ